MCRDAGMRFSISSLLAGLWFFRKFLTAMTCSMLDPISFDSLSTSMLPVGDHIFSGYFETMYFMGVVALH